MDRLKIGEEIPKETISFITRHFRIVWRHKDETKTQAIGAGRYHILVGDKYAERHFQKALKTKKQNLTFKVRGRYVITFQSA